MHLEQGFDWLRRLYKAAGSSIDALSWHTYDFHANEIGTEDHEPLAPTSGNVSRLFDQEYLNLAAMIAENVSRIVGTKEQWLTETNSICHQGVWNFTNAFGNSLWLVNRFGMMSTRGLPVMARQSLIGYNYSLLGNFPAEPIFPKPDLSVPYLPTLRVNPTSPYPTVSPPCY